MRIKFSNITYRVILYKYKTDKRKGKKNKYVRRIKVRSECLQSEESKITRHKIDESDYITLVHYIPPAILTLNPIISPTISTLIF